MIQAGQAGIGGILWYRVRNLESEAVPPFAVMRIAGTDADGTVRVGKAIHDGEVDVLVNGAVTIPPRPGTTTTTPDPKGGNYGQAYRPQYASILYDPSAGTPKVDSVWGVAAGTWWLRPDLPGFLAKGNAKDGVGTFLVGPSPALTGATLNVVVNVCPIGGSGDSGSGLGGISVKYQPVTFPAGTVFGTPFCVVNPTDCCPEGSGSGSDGSGSGSDGSGSGSGSGSHPEGTIDTMCCENLLPAVLHAAGSYLTNTGYLSFDIALTYSAPDTAWLGSFTGTPGEFGPVTVSVTVECLQAVGCEAFGAGFVGDDGSSSIMHWINLFSPPCSCDPVDVSLAQVNEDPFSNCHLTE